MTRTVKHYLDDLSDYTSRIERIITKFTKQEFMNDQIVQDALLRDIEVIGEIVKRFPDIYKVKYPHVPWKVIAGTRDKIIHGYDEVNLELLWQIAIKDIPEFKKNLELMLSETQNHLFNK